MRTRGNDGFSLIEALVATAIFVAGIGSVLQLVTLAIASDLRARTQTEASMLAAQKLEELLAAPWGGETSAADEPGGYRRVWTVTALASAPDSGLIVDVRVSRAGVEQSRLLTVKVRRIR